MSDHEHIIVAGLLQRGNRIADVGSVTPEHFIDPEARQLFGLARSYHRKRGGKNTMDVALARGLLEKAKRSPARDSLLHLVEEYGRYEGITESEFRDALVGLSQAREHTILREHAAEAAEKIAAKDYDGGKRAMREGLIRANEADLNDDRPTDIRSAAEVAKARQRLDDRKPDDGHTFDIGMPWLTRLVSFKRRELTILGGYTADGKTTCAKSFAYHANQAGARVLFVALEMDKAEIETLFVAQHAALHVNERGVEWRKILDGSADAEQRRTYNLALDSFEVRHHEDVSEVTSASGAALHVWSPEKTITMSQLIDRARAIKEEDGLDIMAADYLELIEPDRDLGQYRLNVRDMAKQAKSAARELNIWNLFTHQIGRPGREKAEKRSPPHYQLGDLGESSGVEQAADTVVVVYTDDDLRSQNHARMGLPKSRKGRPHTVGKHILANYPISVVAELPMEDE